MKKLRVNAKFVSAIIPLRTQNTGSPNQLSAMKNKPQIKLLILGCCLIALSACNKELSYSYEVENELNETVVVSHSLDQVNTYEDTLIAGERRVIHVNMAAKGKQVEDRHPDSVSIFRSISAYIPDSITTAKNLKIRSEWEYLSAQKHSAVYLLKIDETDF